jgi:hypothetical protein
MTSRTRYFGYTLALAEVDCVNRMRLRKELDVTVGCEISASLAY